MQRVRLPTLVTSGLLLGLLGACSAPPKPPTVDEARRRPINTETAVALQVCQNELQNTRIAATESDRQAHLAQASLVQLSARHQLLASWQQRSERVANQRHTVRFAHASTQVDIAPDVRATLLAQARQAPLVLLRGRTDGLKDSLADSTLARARAEAVRDLLVAGGVDPGRIRSTFQPVGDHVAENQTAQGRALNRRVEIELYRVLPVSLPMASQEASPAIESASPADDPPPHPTAR